MMYVLFHSILGFGEAYSNITDAYNAVYNTLMGLTINKKIEDRRIIIAEEKGDLKLILLENEKEIESIYIKKINY